MKNMKVSAALVVILAMLVVVGSAAEVPAADNVGSVVALKGTALIERDTKVLEAKLKDGILLRDTVETKVSSRTKMLFVDDSVTLMGVAALLKVYVSLAVQPLASVTVTV